jgi:hypothetical protein
MIHSNAVAAIAYARSLLHVDGPLIACDDVPLERWLETFTNAVSVTIRDKVVTFYGADRWCVNCGSKLATAYIGDDGEFYWQED